MSTEKNVTPKNESKLQRDVIAKNASTVSKINLDKFAAQLSEKSDKIKSVKQTIYIYPETMTEEQKSGEVGKKWRNALRNKMQRFANDFFAYAKQKNVTALTDLKNAFDAHYKATYRINDYSVGSVSQSKKEGKERDLNLMFQIIKEISAK